MDDSFNYTFTRWILVEARAINHSRMVTMKVGYVVESAELFALDIDFLTYSQYHVEHAAVDSVIQWMSANWKSYTYKVLEDHWTKNIPAFCVCDYTSIARFNALELE